MNAYIEFVSKHIPLTNEEANYLESFVTTRLYQPNEIISNNNTICKSLQFVVKGSARSFFVNNEGNENTWHFHFNDKDAAFENYFVVDYQSFLHKTPSPLTFQALEALEVIELSYGNLQIINRQSVKMQETGRIMAEMAYSVIHERIFSFLTLTAKERYLELLNKRPYLLNKFPQYYIASFLGIAPQSLSRLRKEISIK